VEDQYLGAWLGEGGYFNRHNGLSVNRIFELLKDTTGGQTRRVITQSKLLFILAPAANAFVILKFLAP